MKHRTSEPSQRQLRVGEQLRHILAESLRRGHFHSELLFDAGKITITEVQASPDLKNATAYVTCLGVEEIDNVVKALNDSAPIFQKEVARQATLKFTPRIRFVRDRSHENASRIEDLLRDIHSDQ